MFHEVAGPVERLPLRGAGFGSRLDDLLPLAFGTKACPAGDVPKAPKALELVGSVR
jgi:hypothetical protein